MDQVLHHIADKENLGLQNWNPLGGGDINDVYLLQTDQRKVVIKLNSRNRFPGMFVAEAKGLELLASSKSFKIPEVIAQSEHSDFSYLILEFIESRGSRDMDPAQFAQDLAELHQTTADSFGLNHDNYIGSLPQKNDREKSSIEFLIRQRLEPQFQMALEKGYTFPDKDGFYQTISGLVPDEPPALIHGDLWGGNYLVGNDGAPVLIDPAVAFASREMDIAMMQLFGGFDSEIFRVYHEILPMEDNWQDRIPIWQLYYLLVHLNLFGAGYLQRVKQIVSRYS